MRSWRLALVLVGSSLVLLSADAAIGQDTKPKTAINAPPKSAFLIKANTFVQAAAAKKPQSEAAWVTLANQTLGGSSTVESIFEAILAYMKDVAKEAREDARAANVGARAALELRASASELKRDQQDQQIRVALEKIDAEREAAAWQFGAACAAAAASITAVGAGAGGGFANGAVMQRAEPNSGAMTAVRGATVTTLTDGGAPATSTGPTSPIGKVAFADAVLGGKLSVGARDEIRARRADFLDAIVKSWETKTSLMMAIRSRATQNAIIGKERFAFVLPSAVFDAYEEAFAALAKAPKDKTAAFRARVALETLRVVSQNL